MIGAPEGRPPDNYAAAMQYDLVVLGGGTAGLVAAHGAAGIGARVALLEPARTGGDCLWTGCVPSKRLIAAAAAAHAARTAGKHGIDVGDPSVDLAEVMARVRAAQDVIEPHDSVERLERAGVEVIAEAGAFDRPGVIETATRQLRYRKALIATGSKPVVPNVPGLDDAAPLTSDTIWALETLPERLLVLGGGPIGCELGQAFARLGSKVTVVEAADRLLPGDEPEVGALLATRFAAEGIVVHTGARLEQVGRWRTGFVASTSAGQVGFDQILVATGRRPNTDRLGLDRVDVHVGASGNVLVDDLQATTATHVYAAGDVTGTLPQTHVAAYEAGLVVTNALLRLRRKADHADIPSVTFTSPEVARVGMSVADARAKWGDRAVVAHHDVSGLDRAITSGDPVGVAIVVADPKQKIVGATVVSERAGETVGELRAWIAGGGSLSDLSRTVHAYPTWGEAPARAADEILRARYLSPRTRRLTKPVLGLLRRLDRP